MSAGQITISLLMATGSFETDTARAEKRLKAFQKETEAVGKAVGTVGLALGGAAVLAAAFAAEAFASSSKAIDAFNDLKDATGASIENISALDKVARDTGGTFDNVSAILVKFNKAIGDAEPGDETSRVLDAIGLSAANLKKLDPAEALRQTAVALARFADDGGKARGIQILFGKSVKEAAPFLKDLSEQTALVGTTSTQSAEEVEKFRKELFRAESNLQDLARSITSDLIVSLNQSIDKFREGAREGKSFYRVLFDEQLKLLGLSSEENDANRAARMETLTNLLKDQNLTVERRLRLEKQLGDLHVQTAKSAPRQYRASDNYGDLYKPVLGVPDKPEKPKPKPKTTSESESEAKRYFENLQKQLEKTLELTVYEQALLDIQNKRIKGINPELEASILAQAKLLDISKQTKLFRDSEVETNTRIARARLDELAGIERGNDALKAEIELLGRDAESLAALELQKVRVLRAEKESTLARQEAAGVAEQQLQVLQKEIDLLREREGLLEDRESRVIDVGAKDSAKRAGDLYRDTLGDSIEEGILNGFRKGQSLTDIFINELKAQFAKTILRPLIQPVADSGNKLIGDIIGAAVGIFTGGSTGYATNQTGGSLPTAGGRASGGYVAAGASYLVGEKGPEILRMGGKGGTIFPNTAERNIKWPEGGGLKVYISNNTPATVQTSRDSNGDLQVLIEEAANRAVGRVAADIGSGSGRVSAALGGRGVDLGGGRPKRG